MKIKELLYKTPEMTEERLLSIVSKHLEFLKKDLFKIMFSKTPTKQIEELPNVILKEWDLIQEKKSYLTKSQRDQILALVGVSLIEMTKEKDEKYDTENGGNNTGEDGVNTVEDLS